ncbi:MAG: thioesterase domain-containing protein [Candidatus Sulfotelmatobacter sp.]
MTKTSAVEVLTPIWQRVLQLPSIPVNADFFDLGGNPSSAARLFAEIAEATGRDLSPVLIYVAPTIETLAAVLEQPGPPRVPPLLLLRAGTKQPPIFIAHGIGGTVFGFFDLLQKIRFPHAFYGMEASGIDGVSEPLTSIEAMAGLYLDAIKQVQPHGPYFLIGYSLGGLVTLEMAQRLFAGGEKVGLLAMVETYPEKKYLARMQRWLLSFRFARRRAWSFVESGGGRSRSHMSGASDENSVHGSSFQITADRVMRRIEKADYLAWGSYRPRFYPGAVKFVRAGTSTHFPHDGAAVWSPLVGKLEVETLPGNHLEILTTNFERLASVLKRYLNEASA